MACTGSILVYILDIPPEPKNRIVATIIPQQKAKNLIILAYFLALSTLLAPISNPIKAVEAKLNPTGIACNG
jgi:hypothetical protein